MSQTQVQTPFIADDAVTTDKIASGVSITGTFQTSGGTSSQFLKANGTVDSNTYITSAGVLPAIAATGALQIGTYVFAGTPGEGGGSGPYDFLTPGATVSGSVLSASNAGGKNQASNNNHGNFTDATKLPGNWRLMGATGDVDNNYGADGTTLWVRYE